MLRFNTAKHALQGVLLSSLVCAAAPADARLVRVDKFNERCSSEVVFASNGAHSITQVRSPFFPIGSAVTPDGYTQTANSILYRRSDPRKFQMPLFPPAKVVAFFCYSGGSWHKERAVCRRTSDMIQVARYGRKLVIRCFQDR